MRQSGVVNDVHLLGPHDHVCWGFDDDVEFRATAVSFLAAGLARGQLVRYVGEFSDGVHTALTSIRPGQVEVVSLSAQYAADAVVDPHETVSAYASATEEALDLGFTGLRVATDVTSLVRLPAQLDAFTRYEHRADHLMAQRPFSAMCAYDRRVLGKDVLAQLASLHPASSAAATQFRFYASDAPGCAAAIGGELDISTYELLDLALERADPRPRDGELVLDAAELTFIDHASLLTLAAHAQSYGATLVLRTDHPLPHRLVRLLGWGTVRVEAAAA